MAKLDHVTASLHKGGAFEISGDSSITAGNSMYALGRTSAKDSELISFFVKCEDTPFKVEFFEGPTVTAVGTPITPRNKNRNVADNIVTMKAYTGTTVSADGTLLFTYRDPTASGGHHDTAGGDIIFASEWILQEDIDYIFKITNETASTVDVSFGFTWIEEV